MACCGGTAASQPKVLASVPGWSLPVPSSLMSSGSPDDGGTSHVYSFLFCHGGLRTVGSQRGGERPVACWPQTSAAQHFDAFSCLNFHNVIKLSSVSLSFSSENSPHSKMLSLKLSSLPSHHLNV